MDLHAAQFLQAAQFRFNEHPDRILKCLECLSELQVWHRPNEASNSIANLILHLQGNIRQYLIAGIGGAEDIRQRDREFELRGGINKTALWQEFQETHQEALTILTNCTEELLLQTHHIQGFELSGYDAIIHVIEHLSYHCGQIAQHTKWLTDKDLGFYQGMDLNKK